LAILFLAPAAERTVPAHLHARQPRYCQQLPLTVRRSYQRALAKFQIFIHCILAKILNHPVDRQSVCRCAALHYHTLLFWNQTLLPESWHPISPAAQDTHLSGPNHSPGPLNRQEACSFHQQEHF
jgi:hypothetical protein